MQVAFRTDASLQIGSGHVMRCLTLADALRARGAHCCFICREHVGHLIATIQQRGYEVNVLPAPVQQAQDGIKNIVSTVPSTQTSGQTELAHTEWLGSTWQADAAESTAALANLQLDWLVVDHYALDQRWEEALAPHYKKLLVIDDLADRKHRSDLLLDQNLGRQTQDYASLVPTCCLLLIGPNYALLRPEFAVLRAYSLQRRQSQPSLRRLLITLGGVDQPNATGQVLQALKTSALPDGCRITVVMGLTAPWLSNVQLLATEMPWPTDVVSNVNNMAQLMADSDLAIGAAGSTSWERCCLGLPTLMVVLADNQNTGARALDTSRAARLVGAVSDIATQLPSIICGLIATYSMSEMSVAASAITDGLGVSSALHAMEKTYA